MEEINKTIIFAAGCFWGVQYYFDQVPGVVETEVGYIGGKTDNPSYEAICYENTGHAEAVKIKYDPSIVSLDSLLIQFFRMHDPTQLNRQGPDVGTQYRSATFPTSTEQEEEIKAFIQNCSSLSSSNIVTTIELGYKFWKAEDYHQKYTEKTGRGMCHIPYQAT
ncbi:MAG: peptide-methionine (S)-S-oxide reductase MsrA [bacterium]|nr:peptide-methionine (S)-S-oxide reductase MsrA [bacterium]